MSTKPAPALQNLAVLAKNLNEVSDLVTAEITDFEKTLNDLRLGVPAWVNAGEEHIDDPQSPLTRIYVLGYARHQGKWGLLSGDYVEEHDDYPDDQSIVFLKDAPREIRIKAIKAFPKLIAELASEAQRVTEDLKNQLETARTIKAGLKKPTQ